MTLEGQIVGQVSRLLPACGVHLRLAFAASVQVITTLPGVPPACFLAKCPAFYHLLMKLEGQLCGLGSRLFAV
jgi:hypothetical protein